VNIKKPAIIHEYNNKNSNNDLEDYFFSKDLRDIYFNIIYNLKIDLIHINHLINHSLDLLEIAKFFNIPYILNIHDFYYFCPSTHLLDNKDSYCEVKCLNDDYSCNLAENTKKLVYFWRDYFINVINDSNLAIFPSEYSLEFYKNNFKSLNKDKLTIITPGRDFNKKYSSYNIPGEKPIKILFPGYISPHKGSLLIRDVKEVDKNNNFEFHFLGTTIPSLKKYGLDHGRYKRDDFGEIVNKIKPSFIGLFSICPETYSHTLTESWNSNIPVIATDLGAFKERINETGGGWLVDYNSSKKIHDEILKISYNKENYLETVQNINKITFKSRKEMFNDYKKIYSDLI
ncbi:glycosyltransferase, partial [Methanobrevibacter sp. OttesenSCG-928-I08]|nr:glycosyltransferase [Methanobrevibacter sp. OttesenSCG-928-I08]